MQTAQNEPDTLDRLLEICSLPSEIIIPDHQDIQELVDGLKVRNTDSWQAFRLSFQAEQLAMRPGFEKLLSLEHLRDRWRKADVIAYEHQIHVLQRVIGPMRGRAILADEVGLGKTIEAGLVLTEYVLRGLVKRVLVLTPASLCRQWMYEMQDKFGLRFMTASRPEDWLHYDKVIASLDAAKRPENAQALTDLDFDMLIVDEAHKLKNENTQNYKLVSSIRKKYFLLLTATPLQNNLKELYNLISLLRPGQLGGYRSFRRQFVEDNRTPKDVEKLRALLDEVIIRNRRSHTKVAFTERQVRHLQVELSPTERRLYEGITRFIRNRVKAAGFSDGNALHPGNLLALVTLQREICSSSFAAAVTLCKMMQDTDGVRLQELADLFDMTRQIQDNAKMQAVEEILRQDNEKVIIFTEFLATQQYIMGRLARAGWKSLAFDGRCSTSRKEWVKSLFRDHPEVRALVSTETGGEGINLQFCRNMINYDLPWNPMRIEQRIGRIHRLGQTRDVRIYNLYTRETVEEHILRLLAEKINLFQIVVGDLDHIINLLGKRTLEKELAETILSAGDEEDLAARIDSLADKVQGALQTTQTTNALDKLIFD